MDEIKLDEGYNLTASYALQQKEVEEALNGCGMDHEAQVEAIRPAAESMGIGALLATRTLDSLRSYGNEPSEQHVQNINELCGVTADLLTARAKGWYPVRAECGFGKTEMVKQLVKLIHDEGLTYSLLIAQEQIIALSETVDWLVQNGVPREKIGLVHSYKVMSQEERDAYFNGGIVPSEKSLVESDPANKVSERQFVFVSHARMNVSMEVTRYTHFLQTLDDGSTRKVARNFYIHDESLFRAVRFTPHLATLNVVEAELIGHAQRHRDDYKTKLVVSAYCQSMRELHACEAAGETHVWKYSGEPLFLPTIDHVMAEVDKEGNIKAAAIDEARQFMLRSCSHTKMPASLDWDNKQMSILQYKRGVADMIHGGLILDASYGLRHGANQLLEDAEGVEYRNDLPACISYRNLNVHFCQVPSTLTKIKEELELLGARSGWAQELVHLIPDTQDDKVLVFCRKDLVKKYRKILDATLDHPENVSFIHYGSTVTGTNKFSTYGRVIMLGGFYLKPSVIRGMVRAEKDDVSYQPDTKELTAVDIGEQAHTILQGALRGQARRSRDGVAEPMDLFILWGKKGDGLLRQRLMDDTKLWPDAQWVDYKPVYIAGVAPPRGQVETQRDRQVLDVLANQRKQMEFGETVSFRKLWGKYEAVHSTTLSPKQRERMGRRLRTKLPAGWKVAGYGLMKVYDYNIY